jgi:hypothetical protein
MIVALPDTFTSPPLPKAVSAPKATVPASKKGR